MLPRTSSETLTGSYSMLPHKTFFSFLRLFFFVQDVELQGKEEGGRVTKERRRRRRRNRKRKKELKN